MLVPRETWIVFTIRTLNSLGWAATIPFLAVYLEIARGVPLYTIGVTYLVTGLLTFASQLAGGRLTDSIGPKKVMITGYLVSFAVSVVLGILLQRNAPVIVILVMYPLFSLVRGLSQPATSSIIANQPDSNYGMGFSLLVIAGNLGFAIGPALGGILSDILSYAVVFALSGITSMIAAVIAQISIKPATRKNRDGLPNVSSPVKWLQWSEDRSVIVFLLLTMCAFVALGYEITPLSLYVAKFLSFSNTEIGYLFATNGAVIVILQLPLNRITNRTKRLVTPLILSCFLIFCSYMIVSASQNFLDLELAMIVVSIAEIFLTVPAQTITTLFSETGNRGTYQGYYSGFSSIGRSFATFIGPVSLQLLAFDPSLSWIMVAAFSALVGMSFLFLSPKLQKQYEITAQRRKVRRSAE
ncbi:MAG: MFS transporter [Nitrososphaerota archaeon]|nr:MFS transporter [Nitrososphaerota archaeon]